LIEVLPTVQIIDLEFTDLQDVLVDVGGYFSAVTHLSIIVLLPLLYRHFDKSIVKEVKEANKNEVSDKELLEDVKDKVSHE
jgi:hypothetical protein